MVDFVTSESDGTIRMWVWDESSEPRVLYEHKTEKESWFHCVAVSADGRLAVTTHDKYAYLWSMVTGQQVAILQGFDCMATGASISAELVAVASEAYEYEQTDKKIRLYKHDGTLVRTLECHSGDVCDVSFSSDGKRLVSSSYDMTARVWDVTVGTALLTLKHPSSVWSVAWSPCGDNIATACGDNNGRVWDAANGKQIVTLIGHTSWVASVAYSFDGTHIVTGSNDGTVRPWRATDGTVEFVLIGHLDCRWIWAVSFSADGRFLASASNDKTTRIWDVATGSCLHVLQQGSRCLGVSFNRVNKHALRKQQDAMFAVAILCDQKETDPFLPREVWSECLNNISWLDFVQKDTLL